MMIASILSYVVSGFFFYSVTLMAFYRFPAPGFKIVLLGIFAIPAVLALIVGWAFSGFKKKVRDSGIVFLSGSAMAALLVVTVYCILNDPGASKIADLRSLRLFDDYGAGFSVLGLSLCAGIGCLLIHRKCLTSR